MLWHLFFARIKVNQRSIYSRILIRVCAVAMATELIKNKGFKTRIEMFSDCLPVSSDSQNIFSPVSTNIQLEQYHFKNAEWLVL